MKMRLHPRTSLRLLATCILSVFLSAFLSLPQASATTYYWDNNGTTSGVGAMGGTWSASASLWSTDSTGVAAVPGNVTTTATDALNFANSGGTVTVSGTVSAANITATSAAGGIVLSGGTIDMGSTAGVINTSATSFNIASALTGSAGLTKGGSKVLTLSGNNTYTGGTTISTNILKVGSATALGDSTSAVSVTSGAALDLGGTTMTNTNALTIRGTGVSSGGALINSSATAGTYAGLVTLGSNSSIIAGTGDITLSNTGMITGAFGLTVGGANTTTIASVIGTNSLTKQDGGTLALSGNNTAYAGGITVNGGAVSFLNTNAKPSSGTLSFAAGTTLGLGVSGANAFTSADVDNALAGTMTGNISGITVDAATSVGIDTTNGSFAYTVSGSPSKTLVKLGANTLTLTGANASTGGTTINAGTLSFANGSLGSTGNITMAGGTLQWNGSNTQDISPRLTLANSTTATFDTNGNNVTLATGFGGSTSATLVKNGSGTLTLSGANTFTGAVTINAGTLVAVGDTSGVLPSGKAFTLAGGTFNYSSSTGSANTLTIGNVAVTTGANTIKAEETGAGSSTLTIGTITRTTGAAVNLVTSGAGAAIKSTPAITINKGVFYNGDYATATAGGTVGAIVYGTTASTANASGAMGTVTNGNFYNLTADASETAQNFGSGTIRFGGNFTLTASGSATSIGGFLTNGATAAVITGVSPLRQNGEMVFATNGSSDLLTVGNSITTFNSSVITSVTKTGAGKLVLNGANTYNGDTSVAQGTMQVTNATGLGFGAAMGAVNLGNSKTTVASGATLDLAPATTMTVNEAIVLNGGALTNSGSGTTTLDSGIAAVNLSNLGSGGSASSGTVAFGGGSGATATVTVASGAITAFTLTAAGTGYTGTIPVTFTISGQTTPSAATAILSSLTLNGTANTIGGAGNMVINAAVADGTSSGGFSKTGAGTVTLNGTNTYTGNTTVSAGTLTLGASGTFDNSPVINLGTSGSQGTLNLTAKTSFAFGSGQTLSGYGTINLGTGKTLTISGNLAPGNSPGVVAVTGDTVLTGTTTTTMELAGNGGVAGTDFDKLDVSGALTFAGTLNIVSFGGYDIAQAGTYDLFGFGSQSGNFSLVSVAGTALTDNTTSWSATNLNGNGFDYTFTLATGDLVVAATAVPEPSTCAALAGVLILGFAAFRRRSLRL